MAGRLQRLSGAVLLALALGACATAEPRPNLGLYKQELQKWHDSGKYATCFAEAARPGKNWLGRAIANRKADEKLAVVFDIDETLLSNWGYLLRDGFTLDWDSFRAWTRANNDPALGPTKEIYDLAKSSGVAIFLISGRHELQRMDTVRQLKAAGLTGWSGLYLRPNDYAEDSIVPFKSGVRRELTKKGYRIVLSAGDQYSDLEGGFAERKLKLPNPYYFIP